MIKLSKPSQPKTPAHLSAEAKRLWEGLVSEFAIVDVAGLLLATTALESFDRMRMAQKMINEHGLVVMDKAGGPKASPALAAERDARAGMLSALRALHLDIEPLKAIGRPGGT